MPRAWLVGAALLIGIGALHAGAQGCTLCRDTVAQTSPGVQASYRTAIAWMIGAATGVGLAVAWVFHRMR